MILSNAHPLACFRIVYIEDHLCFPSYRSNARRHTPWIVMRILPFIRVTKSGCIYMYTSAIGCVCVYEYVCVGVHVRVFGLVLCSLSFTRYLTFRPFCIVNSDSPRNWFLDLVLSLSLISLVRSSVLFCLVVIRSFFALQLSLYIHSLQLLMLTIFP